jgi:hypothetical protein
MIGVQTPIKPIFEKNPDMKTISMIGSFIVTLALISYSIAILTEQFKKIINNRVLTFLTLGVILDISATICMIIGSSHGPFTLHGSLGYSSLTLMLIDTILFWKHKYKMGINAAVPAGLNLYTRTAYIWWVAAYITGGLLVALR